MVCQPANVNQIKHALRLQICPTCPLRSESVEGRDFHRACEASCPLFVHLPTLKDRAEELELIVGQHEHALLGWMQEMIEADEQEQPVLRRPGQNPLRDHRRQAAKIIAHMMNP